MAIGVEKQLGRRVAALRRRAKLTQERLAEKIGVVPMTVSRLERGVTVPPLKTLELVARAVGVELHDLFDFRRAATPKDQALEHVMLLLRRRKEPDILLVLDILGRVFEGKPGKTAG